MKNRILVIVFALFAGPILAGCAPMVGVAGAVLIDEAIEQREGGDGLF